MANEITQVAGLAVTNGSLAAAFNQRSKSITQAAAWRYSDTVTVSSGGESDVPVGNVVTPGVIVLVNIDATNFVKIGPKSGGVMVYTSDLKPGEINMFRVGSGVTLRWIADTANCKVDIFLLNN